MMHREIKTKWVEALRSGKYAQSTGALQDHKGHCCLGVLCDLVDPEGWGPIDQGFYTHGEEDHVSMPSEDVLVKAGLGASDASVLANLNDVEGYDFQKIADWIEERL